MFALPVGKVAGRTSDRRERKQLLEIRKQTALGIEKMALGDAETPTATRSVRHTTH